MTSRPQISYGDILNSMNVKLVNGVLVYNRGDIQPSAQQQQQQQQQQHQQQPQPSLTKQVRVSSNPIPEEIKKSKIYSKYFSNYKDNNEEPEVLTPKTIEEYKQMITEDKVKRFLAKKRADRIKPKSMFFINNGAAVQHPYFPPMESNFHFK
jgi:hypothetical protein